MPRPWKDLMAIGPVGERANRIFLEAKQVMKTGGTSTTTAEHIPGLDQSVITDRWLKYLSFAMAMDQTEIAGTAAIQEKAEAILKGLGIDWDNTDKLFRLTIVHLVSKDRDYVQTGKFEEDILDHEKILLFVKKHRVTEDTYSKNKALVREEKVGLDGVEIDRIESAAKPLITSINKKQGQQKKMKQPPVFDPSSASQKENEFQARFPDYIPKILVEVLDTDEKTQVFDEWYSKIHCSGLNHKVE